MDAKTRAINAKHALGQASRFAALMPRLFDKNNLNALAEEELETMAKIGDLICEAYRQGFYAAKSGRESAVSDPWDKAPELPSLTPETAEPAVECSEETLADEQPLVSSAPSGVDVQRSVSPELPYAGKPAPVTNGQVGGLHYQQFAIQPYEIAERNKLTFLEGSAVKRLHRHSRGGKGVEDLRKAVHELRLLALQTYGEDI